MTEPKTLTIVLPCLNEADAIPSVLSSIRDIRDHMLLALGFSSVQVVVVNDGSVDSSVKLLKNYSFVQICHHHETLGYGESLRTGFRAAEGRWICFLDMDHSYPAKHIPELWKILIDNNFDMVLGRRSFWSEGMSPLRGFGNWLYTKMVRFFFGTNINDVCSGFRMFRRECLREVLAINESSLGFSLMMSIAFARQGLSTHEHPIEYKARQGSSKLSVLKDGFNFLFLILAACSSLRFKRYERTR